MPFPSGPATSALWLTGIWFGLVTGLLETGLRLGQQLRDMRVTLETIRDNHHWIWMVPVSDVLIFGTCGVFLGLLIRLGPRPFSRLAPYVLCFLAFFALLLTIKGLHRIASVVLACGLAMRTAPWIEAHAQGFRRLIRVSTPVLAGIVAVVAGIVGSHVSLAEHRALARLPAPRAGAPNVLLIVMDDVRIDDLSVYGYHRETTPNLEKLARRAILFDQARSTAPWTLPSHASMLTGRWPHQLSVTVDRPLDATFPTMAEVLASQGYATAGFVGNTYYCNSWYGLDRGFSHYEDFYDNRVASIYETLRSSNLGQQLVATAKLESAEPGVKGPRKTAAMINRDALDWLERRGDRPYFVFLNYFDAHGPFQPPEAFNVRFGLSAEPLAEREKVLRNYARLCGRKGPPTDAWAVVNKAAELMRDSYDSSIAYLDDQIGRLLAELDRRGLLDNTLVIVTSDHGEHFNDHNLFGHGNSLYGALIHVPLLIAPPSANPAASIVHAPVSLRNLAATMADLSGIAGTSPLPGQSLARFWAADSGPVTADDPVLAEVEHQKKFPPIPQIPASLGPLQSLVTGERAYIRNSNGREELYDYEHDPAELKDLAGEADSLPVLDRFRRDLGRHLRD
jgi:arylsulfatase A-like enzyme